MRQKTELFTSLGLNFLVQLFRARSLTKMSFSDSLLTVGDSIISRSKLYGKQAELILKARTEVGFTGTISFPADA
jgi:hypothetical protein